MNNKIIDGKFLSQQLNSTLKVSIEQLEGKRRPKIVIIQVGDNFSSNKYIKNKINACNKVGIIGELVKLEQNTSESQLIEVIDKFNMDKTVDGILVQLPLPNNIDGFKITKAILPSKDADGFNPIVLGNIMLNNSTTFPATPLGIIKLLEWKEINLIGANVVIIGRSNIVGKPLASMLINKSATVTICHTKTKNLAQICSKSDIIISAAGVAKLVTKEFVNENMAIIDVGTNYIDGKYCGDVDFDNVLPIVEYISPVPGGVGPMTIACLLQNVFELYKINMLENETAK